MKYNTPTNIVLAFVLFLIFVILFSLTYKQKKMVTWREPLVEVLTEKPIGGTAQPRSIGQGSDVGIPILTKLPSDESKDLYKYSNNYETVDVQMI